MKTILTSETVSIPETVCISLSHRDLRVTGPRGSEFRSFSSNQLEFELIDSGRTLVIRCWMADKRTRAMVGTAAAHIKNMIAGVVAGFQLSTVAIYKHYPISQYISADKKSVAIRNVVGGRRQRFVSMVGDTLYHDNFDIGRDVKVLRGTNLEDVTQSAARLTQSSKDDMKRDPVRFIDGIYRKKLEFIEEGYRKEPRSRQNH